MKPEAYPKVQAVTAPNLDAEVLFDFNENASWYRHGPLHEGWSLGSPQRLAATGDARTAWGPRTVSFSLQMRGSRAFVVAAQSKLARWLLRPEGWALFQLDAMSPPVWLRMLGAEPQDLEFDLVKNDKGEDVWALGVAFDADPFLYGERVVAFEGVVPNDPTVAGGMVAELDDIIGDAPAPLRAELAMPSVSASVWRIASGVGAPIILNFGEGDGLNANAQIDTETFASGSQFIGGSARICTFGMTSTITGRIGSLLPETMRPGVYRLLVKVGQAPGLLAPFNVNLRGALRWGSTLYNTTTPTVNVSGPADVGQWLTWVDLGSVSLPTALPDMDASEFLHPGLGASVYVHAGRSDATSVIAIDAAALVPISLLGESTHGQTLEVQTTLIPGSSTVVFDSDRESVWTRSASTGTVSASIGPSSTVGAIGVSGGWPLATPGLDNWVHLTRSLTRGPSAVPVDNDAASQSTAALISYHPQWLYLPNDEEATP